MLASLMFYSSSFGQSPLDESGLPVQPEGLIEHSMTHRFSLPVCYHQEDVEPVRVTEQDSKEARVFLTCRRRGGEYCAFISEFVSFQAV